MAITVTKRPYKYCFSGNPVYYELYSALSAADREIYFQYRVAFKTINGAYEAGESFEYSPDEGIAKIDISEILQGFLEGQLPEFSFDEKEVWTAEGQTGKFYLQFREITSANPDPSWDESELNYESVVVLGGLAKFKYRGNNFWINYFGTTQDDLPRPFMTWQKSGRLAALDERMYLAYLMIDTPADPDAVVVKVQVFYVAGTSQTIEFAMPGVKDQVYFIPSGAAQTGIDLLQPAEKIHYWEVWVHAGGAISQKFRYYADNRKNYNDITLHYRSSLASIDSVRIRGIIRTSLEYDYIEQERTIDPEYHVGHYVHPLKVIVNNKEQQIFRGDVGYLEKTEQDRLRDAFIKREVWWAVNEKWLPVNIITKEIAQRTNRDKRWRLPIDFTLAHGGDEHYTPDEINLGEGVLDSNVCLAYLSPLTAERDLSGSDALITLSGDEIDPQDASAEFQYRLIDGAGAVVSDWETHVYADLPLQFTMPKDVVYTLQARSVCSNAIYGKVVTLQIDTSVAGGIGGSGDSVVKNDSSFFMALNIWVNGVKVQDGLILGPGNQVFFDQVDTAGAAVIVEITSNYSPSSVYIVSSAVVYPANSITPPNSWVFDSVNIFGGMMIVIS